MAGGVLYDSCTDQDFTYSANLPAGYGPYWNMDVELVGPDGNVTATSYLYGQSRTGTDSLFSATPRTWPGRTRFAGTVTFRLPMTRTLVQATPKRPTKGEVVRFAIKSQDERPARCVSPKRAQRCHLEADRELR